MFPLAKCLDIAHVSLPPAVNAEHRHQICTSRRGAQPIGSQSGLGLFQTKQEDAMVGVDDNNARQLGPECIGLDQGVETGRQADVGEGWKRRHQQKLQQAPDQLPATLAPVAEGEGVIH